jgi:HD-like signal output (HDOD) protein
MPTPGEHQNKAGFEPLAAELVRSLVGRIQDLLPLPHTVNAILKAVNDPYSSLSRVSETILKDQALTAKVLKLINSAYYGLQSPVGTVSHAVTLLGLTKIKNLAMAISLADGLYRFSGLPFGRGSLWHHSQACGVATSLVASAAGYPSPEEALIAGLIHDIAKALWTELFPERFLAAIKAVHLEGRDPL